MTSTSEVVSFHAPLVSITTTFSSSAEQRPEPEPEEQVAKVAEQEAAQALSDKTAVLLEEISGQLDAYHRVRKSQLEELQGVSVELAVAVAAHLVQREVDQGDIDLTKLVDEASAQLLPCERIQVVVNPKDRVDLASIHASALETQIDLVEDPEVSRGSCSVRSETESMVSSLESRLSRLRDTLLRGIDYARNESSEASSFA